MSTLSRKAGYYDSISDDDRVQVRYDRDGRAIGFMVEGLKDVQGWLDVELVDAKVEAVS